MTDTVKVPIRATYRVIDGEAVKLSAEYADIPADAIARLLMRAFGIVPDSKEGGGDN